MSTPTALPAWRLLLAHQQTLAKTHLRDLFAKTHTNRFSEFSLEAAGLCLDFSKNHLTQDTLTLLTTLAEQADLATHIEALFRGDAINNTEHRAALHPLLRAPATTPPLWVEGMNVVAETQAALTSMAQLVTAVREGQWRGFSGQRITDVVNLGIGGSHLGGALGVQALAPFADRTLNCHFIANIDDGAYERLLARLTPATTLFIAASKSFTTCEMLANAATARQWLTASAPSANAWQQHFIAVTARPAAAQQFGIPTAQILPVWDWVGGRYSLWSCMGITIALRVGMENFTALLQGAHAMDTHFQQAPFARNMPVLLALIGIWYSNFFGATTQAVLPYAEDLALLPAYLQQLVMESNGKRVQKNGAPIDYATAPIMWGGTGTPSQHAFHQLLLQGTHLIPCDFILPLQSKNYALAAHCFAQSQVLMHGRDPQTIHTDLQAQGLAETEIKLLTPHLVIPGNQPGNTLLMPQLNPTTLGALLALYEHKVFVQSVIWNINCFDQYGVEAGKKIAPRIQAQLEGDVTHQEDASTQGLINYFKRHC